MANEDKTSEQQPNPDAPKPLGTEEVNAAITGRLKNFEGKIEKLIADKLAAVMSGLSTSPSAQGGGDEDGKPGTIKTKQDEKIALLQKQIEGERKAREDADRQRQESETRRAEEARRNALADAVSVAGVTPAMSEAVQALLDRKGLVVLDEDGRPAFKKVDKYGNEELIPLKDGVASWLQTDAGKPYLPPKGAQGSGARDSRTPSRAPAPKQRTPEEEKARAAVELNRALLGLPPLDE